jgi:hypothetical protein
MQRYVAGNPDAPASGLPEADRDKIAHLFESLRGEGDSRHRQWLEHIAQGYFSFGPAAVSYIAKGKGSWKQRALGLEGGSDRTETRPIYSPEFLTSNWKLFHDGLRAHHFYVTHDLLPQFGICVA